MSTSRPVRTYATGAVTRALRVLGVLCALGVTAWILRRFPDLPATVPTHLDASGTPDAWGGRASVLVLAGVMLLLVVGIAALSTRPRALNYPLEVTEDSAQTVYREGERMLVWTLLGLDAIYLGVARSVIEGGGGPTIMVGLMVLAGVVIVGIVRLVRAGR
ncbi:DUF1648 domain-containing protein [Brachybacterium sp. YJGR34]|uniref:DUF1648 domain-containing protein n=1 Tax=Brachybacterium sp. YJGR34 TaxID=2059911 RepID=UPI000E0AD967|nr:DUF1648 domain-containing protein [Brachybacterium sp. YJGR34]